MAAENSTTAAGTAPTTTAAAVATAVATAPTTSLMDLQATADSRKRMARVFLRENAKIETASIIEPANVVSVDLTEFLYPATTGIEVPKFDSIAYRVANYFTAPVPTNGPLVGIVVVDIPQFVPLAKEYTTRMRIETRKKPILTPAQIWKIVDEQGLLPPEFPSLLSHTFYRGKILHRIAETLVEVLAKKHRKLILNPQFVLLFGAHEIDGLQNCQPVLFTFRLDRNSLVTKFNAKPFELPETFRRPECLPIQTYLLPEMHKLGEADMQHFYLSKIAVNALNDANKRNVEIVTVDSDALVNGLLFLSYQPFVFSNLRILRWRFTNNERYDHVSEIYDVLIRKWNEVKLFNVLFAAIAAGNDYVVGLRGKTHKHFCEQALRDSEIGTYYVEKNIFQPQTENTRCNDTMVPTPCSQTDLEISSSSKITFCDQLLTFSSSSILVAIRFRVNCIAWLLTRLGVFPENLITRLQQSIAAFSIAVQTGCSAITFPKMRDTGLPPGYSRNAKGQIVPGHCE